VAVFFATDALLVAADVALAPVQSRINGHFIAAASRKLAEIGPLVIGITGSYGKTSTKFAVARLAGSALEVLATPESFNTPLGVCRTINEQMGPAHRYFVVEMGAYREGDIAELCSFVHPAIGVLTAIGPMHLDRFGSMDAIRRGKYEIVTSLPEGGTAVMNVDDPEVRALADRTTGVKVVRYGADPNGRPHVTAEDVRVTPEGMELAIVDRRSGEGVTVATRLLGRHAVGHILAGAAVALVVGRPLAELKEPVAALEPVAHRLQLIAGQGGITVIDDAFNSNPEGAAAALEVLERMPGRKKVVVTPGIVELGELQHRANRTFGGHASRVADLLILVAGVNRDPLLEGAAEGDAEVVTVDSLAEATRALEGRIARGDVVLFENDLPDQYEG
jgi:UDP-N-acetylmuramoyl-tripeptide--D-alanyl-D-alanine ligase